MFEIVSLTEYLLSKHECVVIPGFGGFLRQYVGASLDDANHCFNAPKSWLSFNSELTHNDGLLVQTLMQFKKITYSQALILIQKDVSEIKLIIENRGSVFSFGSLGSISLSMNGVIAFENKNSRYKSAMTFAMPQLTLQPLTVLEEPEVPVQEEKTWQPIATPKSNEVMYIKINRRSLRRVASVAAAIIVMILFAVPVQDSSTVNKAAVSVTDLFEKQISSIPEAKVSIEKMTEDLREEMAADTTLSNTVESVLDGEKIDQNRNMYYIVISAVSSEKDAKSEIAKLQSSKAGSDLHFVKNKSKVYIYISSFETIEEASNELAKVRQDSSFSDAWIFKQI